jgi:hypothetical protein
MIALLWGIALAINIHGKKATKRNFAIKNGKLLSKKLGGKIRLTADLAGCYEAYQALYAGLAKAAEPDEPAGPAEPGGDRSKIPVHSKVQNLQSNSKELKFFELTQTLIDDFKQKCPTTYEDEACTGAVATLVVGTVGDNDQTNFETNCAVEEPSDDGDTNNDDKKSDVGLFTLKLNSFLLLFSLAVADFYFMI